MKVLIDIPNEIFSDISEGYICQEYADELINLVKNGTTLDKIKSEIRKKMRFDSFNEAIVSFDDISKIFDKVSL